MASTGTFAGAPLSEREHSIQLRRAVIASTVGTAIEWYVKDYTGKDIEGEYE